MPGDFSMSKHVSVAVTLPTLRALLEYQAEHASEEDFSDLLDRAILQPPPDSLRNHCG